MPSVQIHDQQLYYSWTRAEGDGPTLLFIHGLGSSSSYYASIIPALVQRGYSCLAFDTPGSALSAYRGRDSDVEAICGAALALVVQVELNARRVIVVGHSMGALVASEMALHLDLLGVVLIGPVNPSPGSADMMAARIKLVESEGMEGVAKALPSAATGPRATLTHKAFIQTLLLAQTQEGYASLCRTIAQAQRPRLEDIKCPLLIIAGSHDQVTPMEGSQHILQSWGTDMGSKRIQVLQGVGHWHCIEAAEEVEALVNGFVQEVTSHGGQAKSQS